MSELDTLPLDCNQLIEASAGTGKTYTITNFYLRLLLGRDTGLRPLAVNEILTLTFTNAATDELRQRIRNSVDQARRVFQQNAAPANDFQARLARESADKDKDGKRLAAAVRLMDEACIFTIHGFCHRVLSEQSFDTGSLFRQELHEDRNQLFMDACADCFRSLLAELAPDEKRQLANTLWPTPEKLAERLASHVFREELELTPAWYNGDEDLRVLLRSMEKARRDWVESDFAEWLRGIDVLDGRRKPVKRLQGMTDFCQGDAPGLESELWDVYSKGELQSAMKNDRDLPGHDLLDLLDAISTRRKPTVEMVRANLWRLVMNDVRKRIRAIKERRRLLTLDDLLNKVDEVLQRSDSLAQLLAGRWPVAMIDEFQDTDHTQYKIFSRVYPSEANNGAGGLLMIGDPKQAIYEFRGADVYTYINAKRTVGDRVHALKENWRSSPALVAAVNALFDRPKLFGSEKEISFEPAQAAHDDRRMIIGGNEAKPFELFYVGNPDKLLNKDVATTLAMEYAAEQTAQLLRFSAQGNVRLEGKDKDDGVLKPGEIVFLVRNWEHAGRASKALARRGLKSVYLARENVLYQPVADDLVYVLRAALDPADESAVRAALATRVMQCEAAEINALDHDDGYRQAVALEFQEYHDTWEKRGIAATLNRLLKKRQLARRWLSRPDGDRKLTDFRHLAELLQQAEYLAPGMRRLLSWFTRERQALGVTDAEQRQLRLESDENLVKIVTVHSSKGLEYDVVLFPMPAFKEQKAPLRGPELYHALNGSYRACLEVGDNPVNLARATDEKVAEEIRLLYVALTRARYRCYLGIPFIGELSKNTFGSLMRPFIESIEKPGGPAPCPGLFDIVDGNDAHCTPYRSRDEEEPLQAPPPFPKIDRRRRSHSYSGLSALLREQEAETVDDTLTGLADDDRGDGVGAGEGAGSARTEFSRFSFPRGARVGLVLHELLENLDPAAPLAGREAACRIALGKLGLELNREEWLKTLMDWLDDILETPLNPAGVSLERIESRDRRTEVEFHFPVNNPAFTLDKLRAAGYLESVHPGAELQLLGMMTGLIDLTFRHDGRYYVLDYKSNHLGDSFDDYGAAGLRQAIVEHHYDLQYLLYSVALHRWLRARVRGYDYQQFGGVFYLFLRGMRGSETSDTGVYFHRPSPAAIGKLDKWLGTS